MTVISQNRGWDRVVGRFYFNMKIWRNDFRDERCNFVSNGNSSTFFRLRKMILSCVSVMKFVQNIKNKATIRRRRSPGILRMGRLIDLEDQP
jgi:hypothetical protein